MGTPAVGSQISVTQVYNFFTGSNPSAGSSIAFRGTLGPLKQPAVSGSATNVGLSSTFGGQDVSYSVSSSSANVSEGSSVTFSISTNYVSNGTTLYYKLAGINTRDLDSASYSYTNTTYTSSGATGYAAIVNKTFTRLLGRYPENSVTVDYYVNNFLTGNYSSLSTFFGDLTGSAEYISLQADPTETGTVSVSSGSASKTFLVTPDYLSEGTESLTFEVRTGSQSGSLVGSSIVSLSDAYTDEGSPVISSFSASESSIYFSGGSTTLSWSTSNADVVLIYKNGSPYKVFNSSTTSSVETIDSNCTFTIYAWNGTNQTTGSTLNISVTIVPLSYTLGNTVEVTTSGNHVRNNVAWYKFSTSGGTFTASTAATTPNQDTEIALYGSDFNRIVRDDDSAGNYESAVPGTAFGENAPSTPTIIGAGTYYFGIGLFNIIWGAYLINQEAIGDKTLTSGIQFTASVT